MSANAKTNQLRAFGHNVADSFACGLGFMIGEYLFFDVFSAAARSHQGFVEVDLLAGTVTGDSAPPELVHAAQLYSKHLPSMCERHGTTASKLRQLIVRFAASGQDKRFTVTLETQDGRVCVDEYIGLPGARPRTTDALGRVRRSKGVVNRLP